jgi:hypothetical protein
MITQAQASLAVLIVLIVFLLGAGLLATGKIR